MTVQLDQMDKFIANDFTYKGHVAKISMSAMLKFNKVEAETPASERGDGFVWKQACLLVGTTYNEDKGTFRGGFIGEILKEDKDLGYTELDHILTTIYIQARFNADTAAEYFKTGDLGKALGLKELADTLKRAADDGSSDETPSLETPTAPGETAGGASDET